LKKRLYYLAVGMLVFLISYSIGAKINIEKEKSMIESNFIRCIINDILSTEEYTLPGIAYYTDTPEEIIIEGDIIC